MRLDTLFSAILDKEGGYVNHPNDKGGPTHWGITQTVARKNGYNGDMKHMTRQQALDILISDYWIKPHLDKLDKTSSIIAAELCDTGFNMGISVSVKWLQRWLNVFNEIEKLYPDLVVDGVIGNSTLQALELFLARRGSEGEMVLLKALNCSQGQRYLDLAEGRHANESFIYGWMRERVTIQ